MNFLILVLVTKLIICIELEKSDYTEEQCQLTSYKKGIFYCTFNNYYFKLSNKYNNHYYPSAYLNQYQNNITIIQAIENKNYTNIIFNQGIDHNHEINLRLLENFLSTRECQELIDFAEKKSFFPSTVLYTDGRKDNTHPGRTSSNVYFGKSQNPLIKEIEKRVVDVFGFHLKRIEPLQIVKYLEGQKYDAHYDWFPDPKYLERTNNHQRSHTIFVYLNDVFEGGETEFPNINKKFQPRTGNALFWKNCDEIHNCSKMNFHSGNKPTGKSSVKYGLNIWIDFNDNIWSN